MPRLLDLRRPSLTLAALAILAGCATATGHTAVTGGVAPPQANHASEATSQKALLARADSAWDAGAYLLATDLYEAAVTRDSSNSHAIFRLATLRAWDNRSEEGVRLYRRYVALEPRDTEGRLALARALAWGGKYSSALAIYDSVITQDRTYRDAVLGRAQTLAWAGRLGEALGTYKRWVADHPTDREASLEYARALSWNGQLDEAETMYTQLAKTGDANAQKGLARVIAWRGELNRSEAAWRQVLDIRPNDAEALTGLAQILSWQGRQSDAETALQLALRANPAYGDARALLRWVQADLRPSVTVTGLGTNDSDHNRATTFLLDYMRPGLWNTTVGGRYTGRSANFAAIDSRTDGVDVFARWQPGTWQLRADAGASRHSSTLVVSPAKPQTIGSGALHASGSVGRALTVGFGASRVPFDETALLIANGVVSSEYSVEAALALPARFSLSGGASRARLTGGTRENTRDAFSSTLRWTHNRRWSLAVGARQFGYDTTSSDGYFAPRKYTLAEVSGRGRVGGALGWNADADLGLGRQSIEFFGFSAGSRLAERAALSAGYRFDPSREITFSGGYANVAGPGQTGGSEYRMYSFALRARLGL
ncbi:MAG TPA: tetratricopeptide repeat protein [Gemmatimonadaceae bacterium]|nr:tetratricopeptide repeat protein [Gemmatimonadaceae bacterium]